MTVPPAVESAQRAEHLRQVGRLAEAEQAARAALAVEPQDPALLGTLSAVLRAYDIGPDDMDHALRSVRSFLHGFATLEAANGFQWPADIDESFEWLITLVDRGLRRTADPA